MKKTLQSLLFLIFSLTLFGEEIDIIFTNGNIITMKNSKDIQSAIAIKDGKIFKVGSDENILKLSSEKTKKIDLEGKTIIPGMVDTHLHFLRYGLTFYQIRGNGKTKEEIVEEVKTKSTLIGNKDWIRGRGWNETTWKNPELPLAKDLDIASQNNPVVLFRSDNHAIWVNSKALELAGITKNTKDPEGGNILRDKDGNPSGILIDSAMNLVLDKLPELSEEELEKAYITADKEYSKMGLTTVFDAGDDISIPLVEKLLKENKIKTRVNVVLDPKTTEKYITKKVMAKDSMINDKMAITGFKIKYDGALGSRGAYMLEEYSDQKGNFGNKLMTTEKLNQLVNDAYDLGYQPHVHAIGDKANKEVLDSFEKLFKEKNKDNTELRYGVVHSQILSPEEIKRYKELDIIAIMQPIHATSDMNMAEDRVGSERIKGAYAWKTLKDNGVIITGGSDSPNDYVEPLYGVHAAVTRKDHKNLPVDGWYPEEALDVYSSLEIYTKNPAYLWKMEKKLGTVEEGKYADLVILNENILTIPKDDLWKVKPVMTLINGEVTYHK
ncbi:amidohydrolase [Cetobacterium somerae]|uniref:amidohydrolase n=1 Tax=Cetobacterium somerae TaxID=188913 RepID=UPI00211E850C|nr:amidohydrolase [Cetobacterium somerae]MCQ9627303.1 amidohydrolase [Cetobacterium somerae]